MTTNLTRDFDPTLKQERLAHPITTQERSLDTGQIHAGSGKGLMRLQNSLIRFHPNQVGFTEPASNQDVSVKVLR